MKQRVLRLLSLCILLSLPFAGAWGARTIRIKKKNETYSFSKIKENEMLKLSNGFGNITIVQWEKDEIMLERKLTVSAPTEESAQKKLESRVVKTKHIGNSYSFTLESLPQKMPEDTYNLDDEWTVYVPKKKLSYEIKNQYGDVRLAAFFKCNYFRADVSFGDVYIQEVQSGISCNISITHGSLKVDRANKANIRAGYSDVNLGEIDNLSFSVDYGDLDIQKLGSGEGKTTFCEMTIAELERKLNMPSCHYGKVDVTVKDSRFEGVDIATSYSDVKLSLPAKIRTAYDLKAKFGDIKVKSEAHSSVCQKSDVHTGFMSRNAGYIGVDSTPDALIKITTEFADITLR